MSVLPLSEQPSEKTGLALQMLIRDCGRELGTRRNLYPRWINSRRLTVGEAAHRIVCMEAIYGLLKILQAGVEAEDDLAIHSFYRILVDETLAMNGKPNQKETP